jgi:hypothetical protein
MFLDLLLVGVAEGVVINALAFLTASLELC